MPRFYAPPSCISNKEITFTREESRHIAVVLRHRRGETIVAFDGKGGEYTCKISEISGQRVIAAIQALKTSSPPKLNLTLAVAQPKGNKFDDIVEKCTELGIQRLIPIYTSRSVVVPDKDKKSAKLKRWQDIVISAAKQSARTILPEILPVHSFSEGLNLVPDYRLSFIATPQVKGMTFFEITTQHKTIGSLIIFIGPEGDFTAEELSAAKQAGCQPFYLGDLVLRTETAAVALTTLFCVYYNV